MQPHVHALVSTVTETFQPCGPVYECSYCPGSETSGPDWPSQWLGQPLGSGQPSEPGDPSSSDARKPEVELDRLEDLARLPFPDGAARTVLCINALEHVFEPRRAVDEMIRLLAPGGLLLLTSSADHSGLADRYWHPTPGAVLRLLGPLEATLIGWQGPEPSPRVIFGFGFKEPAPDHFLGNANRFIQRFQARLAENEARIGWWTRLRRLAAACVKTRGQRRGARDEQSMHFTVQTSVDPRSKKHLLTHCLPTEATGSRSDLNF